MKGTIKKEFVLQPGDEIWVHLPTGWKAQMIRRQKCEASVTILVEFNESEPGML